MSDYEDRQGTWPAVYFIRDDLKNEKMWLLQEMGEMGWVLTEENEDRLKEISERVEEINEILRNVNVNGYRPEE